MAEEKNAKVQSSQEGVLHGGSVPATGDRVTLSGMQAAAYAAYALSDVATIFPITPASHMSEQLEAWSVQGRKNLMGQEVAVKEMQSEKGAAGAMHGALSGGALASTFTASQGLMLMIPNMYKVAGELLPGVYHVTCRSLATHALSIFGDHQDLMATRATGVAMLGSSSVQECMDMSLVAHLSAIEGSLPFVHFMDGFRTSDEIETIEAISQDDMGELVDWDAVRRFRGRAMDPLHPTVRGTAQNSDIYFQGTESANRLHDALPAIVQANMDKVAKLTGRQYHLFDYVGDANAELVVVTMGSSCDVVDETVRYLVQQSQKVGLVKVRLYRPFDAEGLMRAIPQSARVVCALDRTKEPGSQGEPLLQDVVQAVFDSGRRDIEVIGGRYGLSSKDFTPTMVAAVFDNMRAIAGSSGSPSSSPSQQSSGKRRFTVGIDDDITHLSLPPHDPVDTLPRGIRQAVFYGFGSDGTVGANKQAARLLGRHGDMWMQEYSWFDSKKSGGLTISYMRMSDSPVHSPYLISNADYVACHKDIYVTRRYPMADVLAEGGVFVLNSRWTLREMEEVFPASLKRALASKKVRLYNIDAAKVAMSVGLGGRINMVMEAVFLKLMLDGAASETDVSEAVAPVQGGASGAVSPVQSGDGGVKAPTSLTYNDAIAALRQDVKRMYASKGEKVVEANIAAIDKAVAGLEEIRYPESWAHAKEDSQGVLSEPDEPATSYDPQSSFYPNVFWPMERLEGNALPTSRMFPDGFFPLGGTAHEKRQVALQVPRWDPEACIHCYQCSFVCPHAAIRPFLATQQEMSGAPNTYETVPARLPQLKGLEFRIQNYVQDCVGCGSCAYNCPAPGKALFMEPIEDHLEEQKANLLFAQENVSLKEDLLPATDVHGTQLRQPLMEFSSACAGCGETPHVKLLTQLFGDRLIIANATGCSSIWGGYAPALPYCKNLKGHGPAWGNSLFEDNAEYGYGIMKAVKQRRNRLVDLCENLLQDTVSQIGGEEASSLEGKGAALHSGDNGALADLVQQWLDQRDDPEASFALGESVKAEIIEIPPHDRTDVMNAILEEADMFQKKSIWAVGGDGWAFDIDYGGLDEVLASGEDVNVLVLDTEGYSNTGGEMSKSTQLGSVSTFSLNGKDTPKKRLGRMVMQYDYVYVAQVCFGADMQQVITAMREAEAYKGPSLIVALCPCISWGIKAGMGTAVGACRDAVKTGYWHLWRFNPDVASQGGDPLTIDSKPPEGEDALREFLMGQNRFARLASTQPALSKRLQDELGKERATEAQEMARMVDVYRP